VLKTDAVAVPAGCLGQKIGRVELSVEFRVPKGRQYDRSVGLWVNDGVVSRCVLVLLPFGCRVHGVDAAKAAMRTQLILRGCAHFACTHNALRTTTTASLSTPPPPRPLPTPPLHGTTSQPASACNTWTLKRDVTHLLNLFAPNASPAPSSGVMMELDSTVSSASGLTSPFWVRASLRFYVSADQAQPQAPGTADRVVALTNKLETWGRWFMVQPAAP